jgi:pimeloyl-ACP methyl ester carboxylesterase
MVSNPEIIIDGGKLDQSRPAERPPKTNWKTELLKNTMKIVQYPFPGITANVLWYFFTKPGRSKFNLKQQELIDEAKISYIEHEGCKVALYQWGESERRILLSHGWNSKIADFRKMIRALLAAGYQVEGIDMKGHGQSEGTHTNIAEARNILKDHYQKNPPYEAVIGYSFGGLASGLMVTEIPKKNQPKHFFMIAAPSHVYFIFEDTANSLGFRKAVLQKMTSKLNKKYKQPVSYFDLRDKSSLLENISIHLIFDEDDKTITMKRGREMQEYFPKAQFVRSNGLGHYRIIANDDINDYICKALQETQTTASIPVAV